MSKLTRDELGTLFSMLPGSDVDMSSAKQQWFSGFAALDLRLGKNPAGLPVAGADDAVLDFVVRGGAADSFEKMRQDTVPILGMDAPNPILVSFVHCLRR